MTYRKSYQIIVNHRKYLALTAAIFFVCVVIGYVFPNAFPHDQVIDRILAQLEGKDRFAVTFFIIQNNITTAFLAIVFGFLFLPVFAILFNGYLVGAVIHQSIQKSSGWIVLYLLPHGVLELPAIFLAFGLGLRIGMCWFVQNRWTNMKIAYADAFIVFVYVIVPLLIIAGVIEGTLI
jgi:stage II sporulation protein M